MLHPRVTYTDRLAIPFYGTVSLSSQLTLKSKRLNFLYRTISFEVSFPLNTNRTVEVYPMISFTSEIPASGRPDGTFLYEQFGNVAYIVGDDDRITARHESQLFQIGSYLTVYLVNNDSFDHNIFALFEIQRAEPMEET